MSLKAGDRLGPYEIRSRLGAGGPAYAERDLRSQLRRGIDDGRTNECDVRARQELWRFTGEGRERAGRLIQNGLDIVGDNELLFAAMGTIHWQFVNGGIDPSPDQVRQAAEFCEKALAAGGRSAQEQARAFAGVTWTSTSCCRTARPD